MDTLKHYVIIICTAITVIALALVYLVISEHSFMPELLWYAGFIMASVTCIFLACIRRFFQLMQQVENDKQTALDRELERKKSWALFELELKAKETSLKKEWKIFEQKLQNEDKDAQLRRELETKKEVSALAINEKKVNSQMNINESKANSEITINEKSAAIDRAERIKELDISISTSYDPYK